MKVTQEKLRELCQKMSELNDLIHCSYEHIPRGGINLARLSFGELFASDYSVPTLDTMLSVIQNILRQGRTALEGVEPSHIKVGGIPVLGYVIACMSYATHRETIRPNAINYIQVKYMEVIRYLLMDMETDPNIMFSANIFIYSSRLMRQVTPLAIAMSLKNQQYCIELSEMLLQKGAKRELEGSISPALCSIFQFFENPEEQWRLDFLQEKSFDTRGGLSYLVFERRREDGIIQATYKPLTILEAFIYNGQQDLSATSLHLSNHYKALLSIMPLCKIPSRDELSFIKNLLEYDPNRTKYVLPYYVLLSYMCKQYASRADKVTELTCTRLGVNTPMQLLHLLNPCIPIRELYERWHFMQAIRQICKTTELIEKVKIIPDVLLLETNFSDIPLVDERAMDGMDVNRTEANRLLSLLVKDLRTYKVDDADYNDLVNAVVRLEYARDLLISEFDLIREGNRPSYSPIILETLIHSLLDIQDEDGLQILADEGVIIGEEDELREQQLSIEDIKRISLAVLQMQHRKVLALISNVCERANIENFAPYDVAEVFGFIIQQTIGMNVLGPISRLAARGTAAAAPALGQQLMHLR